jgi:hypothetical protein
VHPRLHHQVRDVAQELDVGVGEKGGGHALPAGTARATHSVDVGDHALREVVVDHVVHCFEVNSARHQVGTDQDPDLAQAKVTHDIISLVLFTIGMDHIRVYSLASQLVIKLLRTVFRLDKNKHWRFETITYKLSKSAKLAILFTHIYNLLFNCCGRRISNSNLYFKDLRPRPHHSLSHMLLNTRLHSRRKQELRYVLIVGVLKNGF